MGVVPLSPGLLILKKAFVAETFRPPEILVEPFKVTFPVPDLTVPGPVCA